jgi:DNA-binding PadR family transcriptional regulator
VISSDAMRGYNDALVLAILQQGDSYGYKIGKEIRERTHDQYMIRETTLYAAFTRLSKNGYIEAYPGDVTNGKPRTYYRITPSGRAFLAMKAEEWHQVKHVVDLFLN